MTKKKILLLEGIHPGAKSKLESSGFHVELELASLADGKLIDRAKGFHALGIRSKTQVTETVIAGLPDLETVGCFCIGTDQVNLDYANLVGLPVFNAPYSNTRSVAELVLCEMIALSRRLADRTMQMHKGIWEKSAAGANEVRGKTLGIIGYGHIGSQLSVIAESLGVQVIYYDIVKKLPLGNARSCDTLHDLLSRADFVSLHVPDTNQTQGMMGPAELAAMKNGAYLINASRGSVVDIKALAHAIKNKYLQGAAIDVFPKEPASNKEPFISELQELENVVLTPHIGGSTEEAQEAIGQEVAESFTRYFYSGATTGVVNFPQVDVSMPGENPRILNIHRNVPGVLGEVNGIISDLNGNVVAQHLSTDSRLGYLVMDLIIKDPQEASRRIGSLPTSIRTRVLTK
jgi:D-3-phosphoglycerate dehydrogenase